jgi:hypothetical protein
MELLSNTNILYQGIDANWKPYATDYLNILLCDHHCIGTVFDKTLQKFVVLKSFYAQDSGIFLEESWLLENFPYLRTLNTTFYYSHSKQTIVPSALFNEEMQASFLTLNYTLPEGSNIYSAYIKNLSAHLVYADDIGIYKLLKAKFPDSAIYHSAVGWLEYLSLISKNDETNNMFIDIEYNKIDIAYFSKGALQLYNSFPCNTDEDRLYYTLFVSEQLKANPNKENYFVSGLVSKESETINLFNKYLKNLKLNEAPSQFRYSLPVMTLPQHLFLKSFCSPLCVS